MLAATVSFVVLANEQTTPWTNVISTAGGITAVIVAILALAKFPPTRFVWKKLVSDSVAEVVNRPAQRLTEEHIVPLTASVQSLADTVENLSLNVLTHVEADFKAFKRIDESLAAAVSAQEAHAVQIANITGMTMNTNRQITELGERMQAHQAEETEVLVGLAGNIAGVKQAVDTGNTTKAGGILQEQFGHASLDVDPAVRTKDEQDAVDMLSDQARATHAEQNPNKPE